MEVQESGFKNQAAARGLGGNSLGANSLNPAARNSTGASSFRGRRVERGRAPSQAEEKQFDERTLHIDRVARVVKGGRRFRFRALVVSGDHKGRVGIGIAKGADVTTAITKATEVAKKNLITVPLFKGSLPHEVEAKVGGAHILIKPASEGTGLIAGGVVRTTLEVAGVRNALSKSLGSSNKANTTYATLEALSRLVPASKWVTKRRAPKDQGDTAAQSARANAKKQPVDAAEEKAS